MRPRPYRPAARDRAATHRGARRAPAHAAVRNRPPGPPGPERATETAVTAALTQPLLLLRVASRRASARSTDRGCTSIPNRSATGREIARAQAGLLGPQRLEAV